MLNEFETSDYHSLGIVCKTQKQAAKLYDVLQEDFSRLLLLSADSGNFGQGIVITSAHMAKGLEFDHVVIPDADSGNYHNDVDRGLLYIACTRAMHRLHLMHVKEPSPFFH